MKFRIIKYYERYRAQVFDKKIDEYVDIGSPTGYASVEEAKSYCRLYKKKLDDKIVDEFEL